MLMKAGQILSVVLPEAGADAPYRGIYQAAFAKLQDDAPPMPADLVIETVTAELGRAPDEVRRVRTGPHRGRLDRPGPRRDLVGRAAGGGWR